MEITSIEKDIMAMYIAAETFPKGVGAAHEILHGMVPFSEGRGYYGISLMEQGRIRYLAAAGELNAGEAEKYGLEIFAIKKGRYICETVHDFMKHFPAIGECFQKLLTDPRIDPKGYCLEVYGKNDKDAQCLVKLKDQNMEKASSVNEYIASFPPETQVILGQVRATIKAAAPGAVEMIAYAMPAYKLNGHPLVYFGGFKEHIGFYATPSGHSEFEEELTKYKQGKGSVQFPIDKPMPLDLIARIVKFRVTETLSKPKKK